MKLPLPTTVSTVPPYRRLTAVKSTGTIVRASARSLTATTAGTGTTTAVLTAASPIGVTVLPSARPVMPTTAGTGATTAVLTVACPIGAIVRPSARSVRFAATRPNVRDIHYPAVVLAQMAALLVRPAVRLSTSVINLVLILRLVEQHVREHGRPVTE